MDKYLNLNLVSVDMVELRRTIKCSNCGNEANFYLSTDTGISELLLHGRCPRCGNSLQINYNLVEPGQNTQSSQVSSASSSSSEMVNLDQTLFGQDIASDALKDLIED